LKILKGGSAEVDNNKWRKFDVELDESDLQAIVMKFGIDSSKLSVGQKYLTMVKQAEILVAMDFESAGLTGDKSVRELTKEFLDYVENLPKADDNADSV
jgi:hypothetical protein